MSSRRMGNWHSLVWVGLSSSIVGDVGTWNF